jgi:hypothetical protein
LKDGERKVIGWGTGGPLYADAPLYATFAARRFAI